MHRMRPTAATALLLGLVLGATSACDDATSVGEHAEAEGVAILSGGTVEIYRYMLDDGLPSTWVLPVDAYDVVIRLLDADGEPLQLPHEAGEEEESLLITAAPATVLTWTPGAGPHEPTEVSGTLNAAEPGDATLTVCLEHGGHCDFEVNIPVEVSSTP